MGYHVSILRTSSGKAVPISEAEVRQAVTRMAGRLEVMPGKPDFWLYQPALGEESEIVVYGDGELWTSNPSEPLLELMIELAGYLDSRVRGDELETYRTLDDTYIHPDDVTLLRQHPPPHPGGLLASPVVREMAARVGVSAIIVVVVVAVVTLYRCLTTCSS